jgi:hypothetical protein
VRKKSESTKLNLSLFSNLLSVRKRKSERSYSTRTPKIFHLAARKIERSGAKYRTNGASRHLSSSSSSSCSGPLVGIEHGMGVAACGGGSTLYHGTPPTAGVVVVVVGSNYVPTAKALWRRHDGVWWWWWWWSSWWQ